jgi:hypothetical protein
MYRDYFGIDIYGVNDELMVNLQVWQRCAMNQSRSQTFKQPFLTMVYDLRVRRLPNERASI